MQRRSLKKNDSSKPSNRTLYHKISLENQRHLSSNKADVFHLKREVYCYMATRLGLFDLLNYLCKYYLQLYIMESFDVFQSCVHCQDLYSLKFIVNLLSLIKCQVILSTWLLPWLQRSGTQRQRTIFIIYHLEMILQLDIRSAEGDCRTLC